ncbi:MAG: GNAT family N-acetyltransferase [Rhizobium sp.]|nr:GNAT family N-acetyltransferase [Rhizobium sp.]
MPPKPDDLTVAHYRPEDAQEWLRLTNSMRKHPLSLEQFIQRETSDARPTILARLVCKGGDIAVAIGQLTSSPYVPEGFARLEMVVSTNFRCAGIGSTLLEALEREAKRQKLSGIYSEIADPYSNSLRWLRARGFKASKSRRESRLVLSDHMSFELPNPCLPVAFRIVSLRASKLSQAQFLQFIADRLKETPDLAGLPAWSVDQLEAIFLKNPAAREDWILVAMATDQPIGVGVIHEQGQDAYIYFVGVESQYRALSVGTAILSHLIEKAKLCRFRAVNIDNLDSNTAALRLTEKLGFTPLRTRLELRKTLSP